MSELPREVPSPVGRSARLIQSNPRSKREAGRRWCTVPPAESLLEAGRRLRAVRVSRNRDRGRTLIEPELRQLEPLVVVIPEVPGQRAVKERNTIQNAIAVDVGINVEQVLADVVKS